MPAINPFALVASLTVHAAVLGGVVLMVDRVEKIPAPLSGGSPHLVWVKLGDATVPAKSQSPAAIPASVEALPPRPQVALERAPAGAATRPTAAAATPPVLPQATVDAPAPRPLAAATPATRAGQGAGSVRGTPSDEGPPWPGPGDVDRAARPRWPIRPAYPARARRRGEESTVVVEAWVDDGGEVAFASVLHSGGPEFDVSAQTAVRRSRFRPARREGRDVASRVALRIHFEIDD
jgi:protein TonB